MAYKLITGNTGHAVTPADDGCLQKGLVGNGLIRLGNTGTVYKNSLSIDSTGKYALICPGTYLFQGRHIEIDSDVTLSVSSGMQGAQVGFLFNRTTAGLETITPAIADADETLLTDIDLQDSGFISFGILGQEIDGTVYIKSENVAYVRTVDSLSNPIMYSEHITNMDTFVGAQKLLSIPASVGIVPGRYLAILSVQFKSAPTSNPIGLKIRFEGNSKYDYVVESREAALQVVGIHEFTKDTANYAVEGYIWHPTEDLSIKDLKFQLVFL